MSFPDSAIEPGFELLTEVSLEGVKEKIDQNPMATKKELAFEVVKLLWGEEAAKKAREEFENVFQKKELPENVPSVRLPKEEVQVADLLVKINCSPSNSEAKRLVKQGAVEINGEKVTSHNQTIVPKNNMLIKVGKTRFVKISVE
jgi:tyrosyl-tRNA synthetase